MESHSSQDRVKSESLPAESPRLPAFDAASSSSRLKSPSQPPLPSTETSDVANMAAPSSSGAIKKKGTASVMKKAPKRPKSGTVKKPAKKVKGETSAGATGSEEPEQEEAGSGDESDNGPYCICRGPDDHRWMICCEKCEDWFHGECIHIDKDIGEALIEKFICPNCTKGSLATLYKKTCGLGSCRKPARLAGGTGEHSVFCSDEHAGMWWERMVGRLPKSRSKAGLSDQLTQDELMALLSSGMASFDDEGNMKLAKVPFQEELPAMETTEGDGENDGLAYILTQEEQAYLKDRANVRFHLAEDTLLCHKMVALIELAQERRRAAISAGRFGEDACGYDKRLDAVLARDAFAAFVKSPEGEAIFKAGKLGDATAADDGSMCERKRCKAHGGWAKMLVLGIKHQIREMAGQAAEVTEEERVVRAAAGERYQRKKAENNWVEAL